MSIFHKYISCLHLTTLETARLIEKQVQFFKEVKDLETDVWKTMCQNVLLMW